MKTAGKIYALLLTALLTGCAERPPASTPRRTAYPRPALYDTAYIHVKGAPVDILVNASADLHMQQKHDGAYWLTIGYPAYNAKIYCTFTPVTDATVEAVIDNRAQRISLNSAGGEKIADIESSGGYHANLVASASAAATPVQFLAVRPDSARWVVSGSVFFDGIAPSTPSDSIYPFIEAVRTDVAKALKSLSDL